MLLLENKNELKSVIYSFILLTRKQRKQSKPKIEGNDKEKDQLKVENGQIREKSNEILTVQLMSLLLGWSR